MAPRSSSASWCESSWRAATSPSSSACPFKWYPKTEILPHSAAWRLLDLSESNGRPVDLVIATKFPTYFVRHPHKVTWLIHQYRAAYELCGTPYSDFVHNESDVGLRDTLIRLDTEMLGECRAIYSNARNTAARLAKFNGLPATALYHPPRLAPRLQAGPIRRLRAVGWPHRIGQASRSHRPRHGDERSGAATGRRRRRHAARERRARAPRGRASRIASRSWAACRDDPLIELYAGALAVVYPPYDEDFGYVTLEAFLARKPVITCIDSGGPNEFVVDGINGLVCEPSAEALADAIDRLATDRRRAAALGDAGHKRRAPITWDGVIETLVD